MNIIITCIMNQRYSGRTKINEEWIKCERDSFVSSEVLSHVTDLRQHG